MPSKQQAKMAAAYKVCKLLHQRGELDDSLLPVQDIMVSDDEEPASDQKDKTKRGTKRSREIYTRKVRWLFTVFLCVTCLQSRVLSPLILHFCLLIS